MGSAVWLNTVQSSADRGATPRSDLCCVYWPYISVLEQINLSDIGFSPVQWKL